MVKHQIVVLVVADSTSVLLPKWFHSLMDRTFGYGPKDVGSNPTGTTSTYAPMVKLDKDTTDLKSVA